MCLLHESVYMWRFLPYRAIFVLNLLHLGNGPFPAVIDLFGAAPGVHGQRAALLASRGFLTLALAYFGYKDLPKKRDKSDVKLMNYFEVNIYTLTANWQ